MPWLGQQEDPSPACQWQVPAHRKDPAGRGPPVVDEAVVMVAQIAGQACRALSLDEKACRAGSRG